MIYNYSSNPLLFERCLKLIDESFPGCKEFALNGIKYNAYWNKASTPFVIEEEGEIIAHIGVWPITMILNGKEHHSSSIHGVCVKSPHRGKGYFQQLMHEVINYVTHKFDSSVLFTSKPYLYKKYPYRLMLPEYDFKLNETSHFYSNKSSKISDLRKLKMDNPYDLNLIHYLLSNRVPLSNQLSIAKENGAAIFILNAMTINLYYSEKFQTLIVYETVGKTLFLREIISIKSPQITDVITLISGNETTDFDRIIMQFCPDKFLDEKEYSAILARPQNCIMTSNTVLYESKYFRYPELYWC